jgi:hypothetical protein
MGNLQKYLCIIKYFLAFFVISIVVIGRQICITLTVCGLRLTAYSNTPMYFDVC